jgi:hypothetical protein
MIEVFLEVEVLVTLFQHLGAIIQVNIVCIFPGVVFFGKTLPMDFKLKTIVEPVCVDVLFHDPEVLIVNLDGQWHWLMSMWDHIWYCFGKHINTEHIVNFPFRRQC